MGPRYLGRSGPNHMLHSPPLVSVTKGGYLLCHEICSAQGWYLFLLASACFRSFALASASNRGLFFSTFSYNVQHNRRGMSSTLGLRQTPMDSFAMAEGQKGYLLRDLHA